MNRNGDMPAGGGIVTFSDFGKATVSRSVNADTLMVSGNAVLGGNTSLIDVTCTDLDVTGNFTAANLEIDGITVNENIDITGELDVNQTANFHGPIIAENIECADIDCVDIIADSVTTKTLGVTTMTADDITVKKLHIIEYIDEVTTTQFKTSVSTEGVFSDTIVVGTTAAATDTQGKRLLVLGDAGISGTLGITGQVNAKNGMVISYGDLAMTNGDLLMASGDLTMTDGNLTMTDGNLSIVSGVAQLPVGMQSNPSLTFAGDTNTGLFHPAADSITLVSGGFDRFTTQPGGCLVEGPNFTVESVQTNINGDSTFTGTATFDGGITSRWGVFSGGVAGTTATFSGGVTAATYTATSGSGFSILDTDDHKLLIRTDTSGTYIQAGTTTGNGSGSKLNITTINNRSQTATFDTVNQRVGINQAAPQFTLDVVGDAQVSGRVLVGISGQNSATLVLQDGSVSNPSLNFAGGPSKEPDGSSDTDTGMWHPSDGNLQIVSNGAARFSTGPGGSTVEGTTTTFAINSAQTNVGGTCQFTGLATFNGGVTASGATFSGGITGTMATFSGGVTAATYTATSGGGISIIDAANHKLQLRTDATGTYIQAGITLGSGSGTKMHITTSDNQTQTATFDTVNKRFGINQTSPQFTLDVVGDAQISGRVLVGVSGSNTATLVLQDGTAAAPSLNFGGGPSWEITGAPNRDRNTGIWHPSDGNMQFVSNGQSRFTVGATGCTVNYAPLFYVDAAQSTFSNPATFNGGVAASTLTTSGLATFNNGITATSANIGTLTARGAATFSAGISNTGTLTSSGLATFNGGVTGTTATFSNQLQARTAVFTNGLTVSTGATATVDHLKVNGTIDFNESEIANLQIDNNLSAGSATITGALTAGSATISGGLTTSSAQVNGNLTVTGLIIGQISLNNLVLSVQVI